MSAVSMQRVARRASICRDWLLAACVPAGATCYVRCVTLGALCPCAPLRGVPASVHCSCPCGSGRNGQGAAQMRNSEGLMEGSRQRAPERVGAVAQGCGQPCVTRGVERVGYRGRFPATRMLSRPRSPALSVPTDICRTYIHVCNTVCCAVPQGLSVPWAPSRRLLSAAPATLSHTVKP